MKLSRMLTALVLCLGYAGAAQATTILYRNDDTIGTDYLGLAVNGGGYTVTSTTGSTSGFTLSKFDIVVYANQNQSVTGGDIAQLDAYIAAGGHVILTNGQSPTPSAATRI